MKCHFQEFSLQALESLANFEVLCHHSLHTAEVGGAKQRQSKQTIDFFFAFISSPSLPLRAAATATIFFFFKTEFINAQSLQTLQDRKWKDRTLFFPAPFR